MGYVQEISGSPTEFKVYWTDKGREYLSRVDDDNTGLLVKYFTLGDSDINYSVIDSDITDFVPNISGHKETSCLFGTLQTDIRYKLLSGTTTT